MPRLSNETCPACRHINRDDWTVCAKCEAPRPAKSKCPSTVGPHPLTLTLNRAEALFLLSAVQVAIARNALPVGEAPETYWKRGIRLKHQLSALVGLVDKPYKRPLR